ncbi:MAG: iron-containing redox enzyme family protein [Deltaproteobacteria bacterium]|nr:iron-containing redox enzyme family protein [Deltaproteobacteria bacterium]
MADLDPDTAPIELAPFGTRQLAALAEAAGLRAELPTIVKIFTRLLGGAASSPRTRPAYPSDVVDDHTPYEFSLAIGGATPELRMLVETTDGDTSLAGRWRAARAAGVWLRDEYGADLRRLETIADLFEPRSDHSLLALWHAVVFRPGTRPDVKVYLDLRARGRALAPAVLEEALARLDLAGAYPRVMREAGRRGPTLDELVYFSLDLVEGERARVKVYFRHHHATADDLERVVGRFGGVGPGEVRAFLEQVLGDAGPYLARPPVSCWTFASGGAAATPSGSTLYAPVAYFVRDDAEASGRISRWLGAQGLDAAAYERCVSAFARRPLGDGVGLHSYVSWKRDAGAPKVTCYLAPEAYETFAPGSLAARPLPLPRRPRNAPDLVRWYEDVERCTDHPLFERLAREPAAIAPLWTILANNWVAVGDRFPRWLAALVSRVEDDRVRSVLAKQLDDELGRGDPTQAHRVLFQRMLADLEPYAAPGDRDALVMPGRRFAQGLARNYLDRPELEAIGGTLVAEVYGKQVDQVVGALLRRQTELDPAKLTWLVLHETLEEEHADESLELARMLPTDEASQAAACRGAEELAALGMRYFDDIYEVVFR